MRMCTDTITVFNAKFDPTTDKDVYRGTIIKGVSWFKADTATPTKEGLILADKTTVRIPIEANFGGKSYLDPREYASTPAGDIDSYYTLNNGDIVVHGEATDVSPTLALLQKKYETFTVLSVTDDRRGRAPHWKVVG